jgi:hypothetical protein
VKLRKRFKNMKRLHAAGRDLLAYIKEKKKGLTDCKNVQFSLQLLK